jgi:tRNA(fMet)-specific endonuclease VapC
MRNAWKTLSIYSSPRPPVVCEAFPQHVGGMLHATAANPAPPPGGRPYHARWAGPRLATGKRQAARQGPADAVVSAVPIIAYDICRSYACRLLVTARRSDRPRGAHDLIIAATAVAFGRTVVTADPTGFKRPPDVELLRHR